MSLRERTREGLALYAPLVHYMNTCRTKSMTAVLPHPEVKLTPRMGLEHDADGHSSLSSKSFVW
eukprot:1502450-Amphidinium_carterae.1